jgi:hypothetical protein
MSAFGKPLESNKFNNSDMRMHKPLGDQVPKDQANSHGLDVFERLFRSATKQKAKLIVRVKENIAKKIKEVQVASPLARKLPEKTTNILKENKRLVNNTRQDEGDHAGLSAQHEAVRLV